MNKSKLNKYFLSCLKNQHGFSLVEVLVVMLIFSFLAAGIYATASVGEGSYQVNVVKVELQQDLREAMEWMINDLRQAGNASITDVPADDTWYSSITFKVPTGVTNGIVDWSSDTIQFSLGGSQSTDLQRVEGLETKTLAQNMESMQFRRQSADSNTLEVAMVSQKETTTGVLVNYQLDFSVQLRN